MKIEDEQPPEDYTQRRLRRYHKARARRHKDAVSDARFSRALFSVAGIAAAIAIGLGVWGLEGATIDPQSAQALTDPWIGPLSRLEVYGVAFIAFLGAIYFWRIRKR